MADRRIDRLIRGQPPSRVRTGTRTGEAPVESGERSKTRDRTRLAMLWYRLRDLL